jgi:NAD(P)-dependent dehydrogenase (short-subunit alcohol dehydrogenase family)
VDILVLNAGGGARGGDGDPALKGKWEGDSHGDFVATFQLNVFSSATLLQRLAPGMKERGFGRIVLISSAAGLDPQANQPAYGAAKGAMLNLTVSTAKWLAGSGVTINAVAPGAIMTKMTRSFIERTAERRGWEGDFEQLEQQAVKQMMRIPVGRVGRPEEVAGLVGYLVSQYGGFVHGANIRIDGGVIGTVS